METKIGARLQLRQSEKRQGSDPDFWWTEPGVGGDPQRTPIQWDASPHAGFTSTEPWLPLSPSSSKQNVAVERDDPKSTLALYRRLIDLRRSRAALVTGSKRLLEGPDNVIAYERATVLLSTRLDREGERLQGRVRLRGDERLLVELSR